MFHPAWPVALFHFVGQSINMSTKAKPTRKNGRPRLAFSLAKVETMGRIKASYEMMASLLDCDVATISRRMAKDEAFARAYKKGLTHTQRELIGKLLARAFAGETVPLIFALKNLCGYADKQELRHGGTEDGQPVRVEVTYVDEVSTMKEAQDAEL
jgi:hypothetical protein